MLARTLGMSVKRAQAEIDAAEFAEWVVEYRAEPWGEARQELRHGVLASLTANVAGCKTKPIDFMMKFDTPPKKRQTAEEIANVLNSLRGIRTK